MRKVIDVRRLGDELRRLEREAPRAVERGMREGSLMLRGALVQIEIAKADPQPVDQGQYKGAWGGRDVPGGAIVFNLTKYAAFVERGRRPGRMPPLSPIREWVRRKGLWRQRYRETLAAERRRAAPAIKARGRDKVGKSYLRAGVRYRAKDKAIDQVAWAVRRRIGAIGTKGHGILWLALRRLQPKLPGIIKRSIRELQT